MKRQNSVQLSNPGQIIAILSPILSKVVQKDLSDHFSDHEQLWTTKSKESLASMPAKPRPESGSGRPERCSDIRTKSWGTGTETEGPGTGIGSGTGTAARTAAASRSAAAPRTTTTRRYWRRPPSPAARGGTARAATAGTTSWEISKFRFSKNENECCWV